MLEPAEPGEGLAQIFVFLAIVEWNSNKGAYTMETMFADKSRVPSLATAHAVARCCCSVSPPACCPWSCEMDDDDRTPLMPWTPPHRWTASWAPGYPWESKYSQWTSEQTTNDTSGAVFCDNDQRGALCNGDDERIFVYWLSLTGTLRAFGRWPAL